MKKKSAPENIRKTIYIKYDVAKKIKELAAKDNRTFSSYVALLLEDIANETK